jgi:hypothetical protein
VTIRERIHCFSSLGPAGMVTYWAAAIADEPASLGVRSAAQHWSVWPKRLAITLFDADCVRCSPSRLRRQCLAGNGAGYLFAILGAC